MLPKIEGTIYTCKLPSTGEKVNYRQFVMKEEKSLLLAQQSEDMGSFLNTMASVVQSCTFDSNNVLELAMFDLEYLFLQIRSKSIGENQESVVTCKNDSCKSNVLININLSDVNVVTPDGHTKKIKLTDDVGIVFKYPTVAMTINQLDSDVDTDIEEAILIDCIDYVYDSKSVYPAKDSSATELLEFVENLNDKQFNEIANFFSTMPALTTTIEYTCPKCGHKDSITLTGIGDFFA